MYYKVQRAETDTLHKIDTTTNAIIMKGFSPYVGANGNWYEYDTTSKQFFDTGIKAEGRDGTNGRDGIDGKNGADGRDGVDGRDGKDGADGKDGTNGKDGKDGIDGRDGKDGYTPVKGVDYFDGVDGKDGESYDDTPLREQISEIKTDLGDKLNATPTLWPEWTPEEQKAAQERLGIRSVEEVLF